MVWNANSPLTVVGLMISCIIVDDEPEARSGIERLVARDPELTILDVCKNGREAIEKINELDPNLVLLDIQMPGMTGVEVVESLGDNHPAILFITAYDEFALKAFEVHAVDYLLKPFTDERFFDALHHAKQLIHRKHHLSFRNLTRELLAAQDKLAFKSSGKTYFINPSEIGYIEGFDYFIKIHWDHEILLVRETLKAAEQRLPDSFIRIHKSFIVNVSHVKSIRPGSKGSLLVELQSGKMLTASSKNKQALSDKLGPR